MRENSTMHTGYAFYGTTIGTLTIGEDAYAKIDKVVFQAADLVRSGYR